MDIEIYIFIVGNAFNSINNFYECIFQNVNSKNITYIYIVIIQKTKLLPYWIKMYVFIFCNNNKINNKLLLL